MVIYTKKYYMVLLIVFLCACSAKNIVPQESIRIGVTSYMQPTNVNQLFAGMLSPYRVLASVQEVKDYTTLLYEAMEQDTQFAVVPITMTKKASLLPTPLEQWIAVGEEYKVDFLLIPQIFTWKPSTYIRKEYIPAVVIVDYYLLDVKQKILTQRSRYYEDVVMRLQDLRYATMPNGMFYKEYATLTDLAKDSIYKMLQDFHFIRDLQERNIIYQ